MEWISMNKEWIFSGVGIFTITVFCSLIAKMLKTRKLNDATNDRLASPSISINSNNIITGNISGRDIEVHNEEKRK